MKKLTDLFDKVFVINCEHRPDRKERVLKHLEEDGLVDLDKVIVYPAIIGDWTTCPADWKPGNGAWGCMRSHQRIMEDLMHCRDERMQMDWSRALILEDDVVFLENALADTNEFMEKVPSDWGQIYLGGQHQADPKMVREKISLGDGQHQFGEVIHGVLQGMSINRTHAYAVHKNRIGQVYRHICYATDYRNTFKHVDHQLELAHNREDWPVYCPERWVCGQEEGTSNVSGKTNKREVWQRS